ncbi:hypothetical protein [Jatrophihabitans fulvus]
MPPADYYDHQLLIQTIGVIVSAATGIVAAALGVRAIVQDRRTRNRAQLERARQVVVEFVPVADSIRAGAVRVFDVPGFEVANGSDQAITNVQLNVDFYTSTAHPDPMRWRWKAPEDNGWYGYVFGGNAKTRVGNAKLVGAGTTVTISQLRTQDIKLILRWRDGAGTDWVRVDNGDPQGASERK